jgi:hypothetical protein
MKLHLLMITVSLKVSILYPGLLADFRPLVYVTYVERTTGNIRLEFSIDEFYVQARVLCTLQGS